LDLREEIHSRPASRGSFRQPVETVAAPCEYTIILTCKLGK
jgi:hypothetical protein